MSRDQVRRYRPSMTETTAILLTEENLEAVEQWSGGAIKGTKLVRSARVIDVYDSYLGETRASIGDYVVATQFGAVAMPAELFNRTYEEVPQ